MVQAPSRQKESSFFSACTASGYWVSEAQQFVFLFTLMVFIPNYVLDKNQ